MFNLLSKLQRKPEAVRRRMAVIASAVITGLIVLFWLISISVGEREEPVVAAKEETGPVQALSEGLGVFISDTKEILKEAAGLFAAFKDMDEASETATSTVLE